MDLGGLQLGQVHLFDVETHRLYFLRDLDLIVLGLFALLLLIILLFLLLLILLLVVAVPNRRSLHVKRLLLDSSGLQLGQVYLFDVEMHSLHLLGDFYLLVLGLFTLLVLLILLIFLLLLFDLVLLLLIGLFLLLSVLRVPLLQRSLLLSLLSLLRWPRLGIRGLVVL